MSRPLGRISVNTRLEPELVEFLDQELVPLVGYENRSDVLNEVLRSIKDQFENVREQTPGPAVPLPARLISSNLDA